MGLLGGIARGIGEIAGEAKKRIESDEWKETWKKRYDDDAEEREKIHQAFVNGEKKRYLERKTEYEISKILEPIMQEIQSMRDFSPLDNLDGEYRNSEIMKRFIYGLRDKYYEAAVKGYFDGKCGIRTMLFSIRDLVYFDELTDDFKFSMKHYYYFADTEKDISSILTGCEDIGKALKEIRDNAEFYERFINEELMDLPRMYKALKDEEDYIMVFDFLVHANKDTEFFDNVKYSLLFAALQENNSESGTILYETMQKVNDEIFQPIKIIEDENGNEKSIHIRTVDLIIADALKYANANVIDNINKKLSQFLNDFGNSNYVSSDQYEVLRKVFAYLKAYKQEAMVLEAMVVNNVPRSAQQEKRLAFLKSDISKMDYSTPDLQSEIETNENQLVYEYKCLSWSANEIKAYFDMLSSENRAAVIPLVIDEWNKSLELENVEWNNEKLSIYLAERLKEHFGERFVMNAIDSGTAIGDWIDFAPSVFITEKEGGIYPWIGFIITGEQLTLTQITFSIYAVYLPENDFVQEKDALQKNSKMASKVSTLKLKQNPKINNYFNTVNNVLVSELENWINDSKTQDIYN